MVTGLLDYEKVAHTEAKAKEMRGLVEKMITLGKKGDLHSHRQALSFIIYEKIAEKVFAEFAPRYAERPVGYISTIRINER